MKIPKPSELAALKKKRRELERDLEVLRQKEALTESVKKAQSEKFQYTALGRAGKSIGSLASAAKRTLDDPNTKKAERDVARGISRAWKELQRYGA